MNKQLAVAEKYVNRLIDDNGESFLKLYADFFETTNLKNPKPKYLNVSKPIPCYTCGARAELIGKDNQGQGRALNPFLNFFGYGIEAPFKATFQGDVYFVLQYKNQPMGVVSVTPTADGGYRILKLRYDMNYDNPVLLNEIVFLWDYFKSRGMVKPSLGVSFPRGFLLVFTTEYYNGYLVTQKSAEILRTRELGVLQYRYITSDQYHLGHPAGGLYDQTHAFNAPFWFTAVGLLILLASGTTILDMVRKRRRQKKGVLGQTIE